MDELIKITQLEHKTQFSDCKGAWEWLSTVSLYSET